MTTEYPWLAGFIVAGAIASILLMALAMALPGFSKYRQILQNDEVSQLRGDMAALEERVKALEAERNGYVIQNEKLRLELAIKDYAYANVVEGVGILTEQLVKRRIRPLYSIEALAAHLPAVIPQEP